MTTPEERALVRAEKARAREEKRLAREAIRAEKAAAKAAKDAAREAKRRERERVRSEKAAAIRAARRGRQKWRGKWLTRAEVVAAVIAGIERKTGPVTLEPGHTMVPKGRHRTAVDTPVLIARVPGTSFQVSFYPELELAPTPEILREQVIAILGRTA
jgi:hypothetical protein